MARKRAFVFLQVDTGKEEKVTKKLLKFDEVKEVHIITGENDLIAVLETEHGWIKTGSDMVFDLVKKIRRIAGVLDTETVIPLRSEIKGSK